MGQIGSTLSSPTGTSVVMKRNEQVRLICASRRGYKESNLASPVSQQIMWDFKAREEQMKSKPSLERILEGRFEAVLVFLTLIFAQMSD